MAAALGLALGLALHGPWQDDRHGGGPQLQIGGAAAAERAVPAGGDIVEASVPAQDTVAYADTAYAADTSQLPPEPLPVTRLTRRGGTAIPASADVERVSTETAQADDVTTVGDFRTDDATPAATARAPIYAQASYTQAADER